MLKDYTLIFSNYIEISSSIWVIYVGRSMCNQSFNPLPHPLSLIDSRYCSWTHIFFFGRCISQSAWWNKNSENTIYFEGYFWYTRWGSKLQSTTGRAARRFRLGWGPAPWWLSSSANNETQLRRTQWHMHWDSFILCVAKVWTLLAVWQILTPEALYEMVHWLIQKTFPAVYQWFLITLVLKV